MNTHHLILGIDIGKDTIVVGFLPEAPDAIPPKNWRSVVSLSYKDPRWWETLLDLIDEHATVAAEPTGHHLLAPIAAVLYAYKPNASLWTVAGKQTAYYRASFVASAKNDRLDAIALTLIAHDIAAGQPPRNCRPYNYFLESAVQRLRMLINRRVRLVKENTRTKNQLNILAHSLFPAFAGSPTWARAVRHGAVTPAQIKALAAEEPAPGDYARGNTRHFLRTLASSLPDIDADPATAAAIADEIERRRYNDQQIAQVEAQLRAVINHPPFATVTRRWRTIPNAGDLAIAALHVASLGRVGEFDRDDFCAACGVTPRTNSSGSIDRTRASHRGYAPVRVALHLWALGLLSPNAPPNPIKTYFDRGKKLPACKNKLARILWGTAARPTRQTLEEAGESPPAGSVNEEETP